MINLKKIEVCKNIYREAFNDDDIIFEDLLFENCFEYLKTIEVNGIPVSMFFALPCVLKTNESTLKSIYIYAAATDKQYRGKGYMGKLIEKSKLNNELIFLRPAEESLIEFYSRFDFLKTNSKYDSDFKLVPIDGFEKLVNNISIDKFYDDFVLMYFSKNNYQFDKIKFPYSMN